MNPQGKAQQLKCWDDKTASGPEKVNQVSLKHKNDTRLLDTSVYWCVPQYDEQSYTVRVPNYKSDYESQNSFFFFTLT